MKTKREKVALFDELAPSRGYWKKRNRYYYDAIRQLMYFIVPRGKRILELGCGTGELIESLHASYGVGIDFSAGMIEQAGKQSNSNGRIHYAVADAEEYLAEEDFDYIIMSDLLGESSDVQGLLESVHQYAKRKTRIVITYFNPLWELILRLGEKSGLKMPQDHQNWLSVNDVENLLQLSGFEVIKSGRRLLLPKRIPALSFLINRYIANLPLLNRLCLVNYTVARKASVASPGENLSVSVVIPCRNEDGNIRSSIERLPVMGSRMEIIYVDGNSNDNTVDEINRIIADYRGIRDIKLIHQVTDNSSDGEGHGRMLKLGKGDAVRKGFAAASGDVLMILDADLTVKPEELPRFYNALADGKAEYVNGTRLVYPMEREAMRSLNKLANKLFALAFSWILGQRIRDTLCGTKALFREQYQDIADNREYFGNFDPFGDFDLLFGAAKLNLKIMDLPVHYVERVSGEVKIDRLKHGLLLLKMCMYSVFKLKFVF